MSQEKRCLECGFFCDNIGELNEIGEKIVQCCGCISEMANQAFTEENTVENFNRSLDKSTWLFWCPTCGDTAAREWEYRINEIRKEDQNNSQKNP